MQTSEELQCASCRRSTREDLHTEHQLVVSAAELREQAERAAELRRRGQLVPRGMCSALRAIEEAELQRTCDAEVGGCGVRGTAARRLERAPRVLMLQLIWSGSGSASLGQPAVIRSTMRHVNADIDLREMFAGGSSEPGPQRYRLRCMACACGPERGSATQRQGHCALVQLRMGAGSKWLLFPGGGAAARVVGGWQDLLQLCETMHVQPMVLFYEAVE